MAKQNKRKTLEINNSREKVPVATAVLREVDLEGTTITSMVTTTTPIDVSSELESMSNEEKKDQNASSNLEIETLESTSSDKAKVPWHQQMNFKSYEDISLLSELQDIDPGEDGRGVTWCALTTDNKTDNLDDENPSEGDALNQLIQSNSE